MDDFVPFFDNPHLATIAGNFWSRPNSEETWPRRDVYFESEPGVKVLVHSQSPSRPARAEIVIVHGLEGSSDSGYARSLAWNALSRDFAVHRFNMRGCGGAEALAPNAYHAGQTSDLVAFLKSLKKETGHGIFVAGFSLGGNVALKFAGEAPEEAASLLVGVFAASAPIDLAICAAALGRKQNALYERRFLSRLKERVIRGNARLPQLYPLTHLPRVKSIVDFDEHYTAKIFGFGTAAQYFKTQSSNQFLEKISIPALVVTAQDDPMVPFQIYDHPAFKTNPNLTLVAPKRGGHLGFLARHRPRFWLDEVALGWMESILREQKLAEPRIL